MKPTEILKHEHEIVLIILAPAEREAKSIRSGKKPDGKKLKEMIDFFKVFVDRCHHAKEERYLFPKVVDRGLPRDTGPIPTLLLEHDEGRKMVASMSKALAKFKPGDKKTVGALWGNLLSYVELMREHTDKEDNIFFPMAEELLKDGDRKELIEAFERIEKDELGEGTHEKYHKLARDLAEGKP